MPLTKKQVNLIAVVGTFFLGGVGLVGWYMIQGSSALVQPPRPSIPAQKAQTLGNAQRPEHPLSATQNHVTKNRPGEQIHAALSSKTKLGDLARMRGQQYLLAQELKIAKLEQELKETKRSASLQAQPAPQPEIILPALEPPKKEARAEKAKSGAGPVVLSVQGIGGKLSATIRTADGRTVTLKNGERFGGGVLSVTRKSVFIRTGGASRAVPFME